MARPTVATVTIAGRHYWWEPTRRWLRPVISGGDGPEGTGDGDGGDGSESDTGDDGSGDPGKTFSQAEVTALAAREKQQGRSAALNEITEQLGCTPEEAKAILDAHREAEDAAKTQAQRDAEAAAAAKAQAEADRAQAAADRRQARLERAVPTGVEGTAAQVVVGQLDARIGAAEITDELIATHLEAVKSELPGLFTTSDPAPPTGKPPSPGGANPPPRPGSKTAAELAKEIHARRFPKPKD